MKLETKIRNAYFQFLREEGKPPKSLAAFLKPLKITERQFYQHFSSLEAIEERLWSGLIVEVVESIQSGKEYAQFSAEQRLLSFGFGFLEKAIDYRSVMQVAFKKVGPFHFSDSLDLFGKEFKTFAQTVIDHGIQKGEIADRSKLTSLYKEGLYLMFRGLLDFHLQDKSPRFERSDAYWEKAVRLAFDLMKTQAIDSAFDLAKFLIPQKAV